MNVGGFLSPFGTCWHAAEVASLLLFVRLVELEYDNCVDFLMILGVGVDCLGEKCIQQTLMVDVFSLLICPADSACYTVLLRYCTVLYILSQLVGIAVCC